MANVLTKDQFSSLMVGLSNKIHTTGSYATPALSMLRVDERDLDSKEVWLKQNLTTMTDALGAAIVTEPAAGTVETITVAGGVGGATVLYFAGYTDLLIESEFLRLISIISSTSLSIKRGARGTTPVAHADETRIYIFPTNATGAAKLGRNDSQLSSRNHNFAENFQLEIPTENLIRQGRRKSFSSVKEGSPKHQLSLLAKATRRVLEVSWFYGVRNEEGGAAVSDSDLTLTSDGGKVHTGGLRFYLGLDSGISNPSLGAPISELDLQSDIRELRDRGAFSDLDDTSFNEGQCMIFCSLTQKDKIAQIVFPYRVQTDLKSNEFGTNIDVFDLSGIRCRIIASQGVQDSDIFYVPNNKNMFKIRVQRFVEPQEENVSGDQTTDIYATTWLNEVGNAFIVGERTGLSVD